MIIYYKTYNRAFETLEKSIEFIGESLEAGAIRTKDTKT